MTQFTDITAEEIDALIKRLEEAELHQFVLASEDVQLIIAALSSLVNLQGSIASKGSSLDKLRRLCGFIQSSEKTKNAAKMMTAVAALMVLSRIKMRVQNRNLT